MEDTEEWVKDQARLEEQREHARRAMILAGNDAVFHVKQFTKRLEAGEPFGDLEDLERDINDRLRIFRLARAYFKATYDA